MYVCNILIILTYTHIYVDICVYVLEYDFGGYCLVVVVSQVRSPGGKILLEVVFTLLIECNMNYINELKGQYFMCLLSKS